MAQSATNRPRRRALLQPDLVETAQFPLSRIPAANVSQVELYSPLRYPGGKTWLIPHIKEWLAKSKPKTLIEPFAGGAIVSLTAVMEKRVDRVILIERDPDVAAFWRAALQYGGELAKRVRAFRPTSESIRDLERAPQTSDVVRSANRGCGPHKKQLTCAPSREHEAPDALSVRHKAPVPSPDLAPECELPEAIVARGFRTLVLNRTRRAGILAAGAASIQRGEDDKGVASRWYPDTLASRLEKIQQQAHRIEFYERDSTEIMQDLLRSCGSEEAVFVDPPYTAGGRYAGRRLYTYNDLDHERLFKMLADRRANVLMTYDASPEIAKLVEHFRFHAVRVSMRTAHHHDRIELIITRDRLFCQGGSDD